jgi:hypothetical protein
MFILIEVVIDNNFESLSHHKTMQRNVWFKKILLEECITQDCNALCITILYNALALTRGGKGGQGGVEGGGVNLVYNGQMFQRENMFGALCM